MKTLVLANQKGGVGKSAVATLLAHLLAQNKQRVLAIDLDHQGNFTQPLTLSKRPVVASITSSTSWGAEGITRRAVRRIFSSSAIRLVFVCRRPAVSTMT